MKGFMDNYFAEDSFHPYGDAERQQMKRNMWDVATTFASVLPIGRAVSLGSRGLQALGFFGSDIGAYLADKYLGQDAGMAVDSLNYLSRSIPMKVASRTLDYINPNYGKIFNAIPVYGNSNKR